MGVQNSRNLPKRGILDNIAAETAPQRDRASGRRFDAGSEHAREICPGLADAQNSHAGGRLFYSFPLSFHKQARPDASGTRVRIGFAWP
jgi:hypothetical protein